MPDETLTRKGPGAARGPSLEAEVARATLRNDDLIDPVLIRHWLLWGFFWLMFAPTIGVLVSTKFNYPAFLGEHAWSTFGRLRPVHVNGVIWGASPRCSSGSPTT